MNLNRFKSLVLVLILFSFVENGLSQTKFYAVASGAWNASGTWSLDGFTPITCAPCVEGVDFPGASDDAYTSGFSITLGGNRRVRDLFVEDVAASIIFPGLLTVNGAMLGWNGGFGGFANDITTNVFSGVSNLLFTANDLSNAGDGNLVNNEVIAFWNNNTPINVARFQLSNPASIDAGFSGGNIRFTAQFNILSGNLSTGFFLSGIEIGTQFILGANTSFVTTVPIYGTGGVASRITFARISSGASLDLSTASAYLNSSTFQLLGTGSLEINFAGSDQTQGWWYQSNFPSSVTINEPSSITYEASSDQIVAATSYGNLILSSPFSASNKELQATNTLVVNGDLTINSGNVTFNTTNNLNAIDILGNIVNNGSWTPNQLVTMSGSIDQQITGDNEITFNGGLRIENTSGTVSLFNQNIDINGQLDIDPSATFDPDVNNVIHSGDLQNDGVLTAGTVNSTYTFDGTTSITGTGSHNFNDVIVSNTLTAPTNTMNVSGNWTNSGTFDRNDGTVLFNGTSQSLIGTTDFHNITVAGSVTNTGSVNLHGVFTPTSGSFNTGNDFTVMSTSLTDEGRIGAFTGAFSFSGNMTTQRFVDGIFDGDWRYFSSPVIGATLNDWLSSGMPITGSFSDASPDGVNNVVSSTAPSVYVRNSSAGTWDPITGASTGAVTLTNGTGYSAYTYVNGDLTLETTGTLASGNISTSLTGAGGADPFYLVGNPYPSAIDWDAVYANNTSLGTTVYIRIANNVYANYNQATGVGTNGSIGWSGQIAMGQSFWIDNTAAVSSIDFTESMKVDLGTGSFLREEGVASGVIKLRVSNDTEADETVVFLASGATDAFEPEFDGRKQLNGYYDGSLGRQTLMNLSSYNVLDPSELFVFNGIDSDFCNKTVNLEIRDVAEGIYTLEVPIFTVGAYSVSLRDEFIDNELILSSGSVYVFEVTSDVNSYGADRFILEFAPLDAIDFVEPEVKVNYNCSSGQMIAHLSGVNDGLGYALLDGNENAVSDTIFANNNQASLILQDSELEIGVTSFSIVSLSPSSCIGTKTFENLVEIELQPLPEIESVTDAAICADISQNIQLVASASSVVSGYNWYNNFDDLMPFISSVSGNIEVANIDAARSFFVSAFNENGCEGERREVKLVVDTPSLPIIANAPAGCVGSTVQLTASGAKSNEFYNWYASINSETPIEGVKSNVLFVEIDPSNLEYYVSITNGTGCESERVAASISIEELVAPQSIGGSGCVGSTALLEVSGAVDNQFYNWYVSQTSENPIEGENSNSISVDVTGENKSYYASIMNEFGCESPRVEVVLESFELPIPVLEVNGNTLTVDLNADFYEWYLNDELIVGAVSNSLEVVKTGTYKVKVGNNGCEAFSNERTIVITDIDDKLYELGLNIYPNPFEDKLRIHNMKDLNARFSLYTVKGEPVLVDGDLFRNNKTFYFNTKNLKSGLYILNIEEVKGVVTSVQVLKK